MPQRGVSVCVSAACAACVVAAVAATPRKEFSGIEILRQLGYFPTDGGASAKLLETLSFGVDEVVGTRTEASMRFDTREFWAVKVCAAPDPKFPRPSLSAVAHTMSFCARMGADGDPTVIAHFNQDESDSTQLRWLLGQGTGVVSQEFRVQNASYKPGDGLDVGDKHFLCEDGHVAWLRRVGNITYDCADGHTVVLEYPTGCPGTRALATRDPACYPRISITGPVPSGDVHRRATAPYLRFSDGPAYPVAVGYRIDDAGAGQLADPSSAASAAAGMANRRRRGRPYTPKRRVVGLDVPLRQMQFGRLLHAGTTAEVTCMSRAYGVQQTLKRATAMSRLLDSLDKKTFRCKLPDRIDRYGRQIGVEAGSYSIYVGNSKRLHNISVNSEGLRLKRTDNFNTTEVTVYLEHPRKNLLLVFSARLEQVDAGEALTVGLKIFEGWQFGKTATYRGPRGETNTIPEKWCAQMMRYQRGCMITAVCEHVQVILPVAPEPEYVSQAEPDSLSDPAATAASDTVIADAPAVAADRPEAATGEARQPEAAPASSPSWVPSVVAAFAVLAGVAIGVMLCMRVAIRKSVRSAFVGHMPPQIFALSDGLAVHLTEADGEGGRELADRASPPPTDLLLI